MLSLLFAQLAVSIRGQKKDQHTFDILDYSDQKNKEISIIKQLEIRFAQVDLGSKNASKFIKTIDDMKDILEHSVEVVNNGDQYTVIKQTIKNIASKEQRIDLSTAIMFDEDDKEVETYYISNFGIYLNLRLTHTKTWVFQNHPLVTNYNELSWGKKTMRFFTDNSRFLKEDKEYNTLWFAESWTNNWFQPGESKTFSFMIHDDDYQPPFLELDKSVIRHEYFTNQSIQIQGAYYTNIIYSDISIRYRLFDSTGKVVMEKILQQDSVTEGRTKFEFSKKIDPITTPGSYTLVIISSNDKYNYTLEYPIEITVDYPNAKPRIIIFDQDKTYFIPNTDAVFTASITDANSADKTIDTRVYFDGKEVFTKAFPNTADNKTISFKIPKDAKPGIHELNFTASDGKKVTITTLKITVKDNTVLSVDFEPKLKESYHKGDKISFNAYIVDPDTNTDTSFKVSLLYGETFKQSKHVENLQGEMRIPLSLTIPETETSTKGTITVKVEGQYESVNKTHPFSIFQEAQTGELASSQIAKKEAKKKTALVAVLSVFVVLAVIVAIVIVVLWLRK
ncbi:hypothetical protein TVAG_393400 [Trichomonas vaginalis G3]|uniref:Bap-like n=1 Tax=Trichomonas vaginalis (strain ATCC PRA-98 / G3) TaxID=412133 RepID=A2DYD6_TRIV3|nr:hypothetical protein TVAGG3_0281960 [Trichomonas vaginalis G3]EAY14613.1 hypothetical protein TVAG_393400 [Trichomonas vaginalis G3]KAI5526623.1 hypothetical protein TVAGG3_0281960 [Trichomonas vaginalis G3]|eukprot:XP_001326836.1 hypothetical protein [Trichomonas vaginalis G3]